VKRPVDNSRDILGSGVFERVWCVWRGISRGGRIDRKEQDRCGSGKDQGADQGEPGNVVGIGGLRDQQVDESSRSRALQRQECPGWRT